MPTPVPTVELELQPQFDLNALPPASAQYLIPSRLVGLGTGTNLQRVADELVLALRRADYGDRVAFYWLGGDGFVAITRFEQISDDGAPAGWPQRWSSEALRPTFGDPGWLKALFFPPGSRYRFIVFAVTPSLVRTHGELMSFGRFVSAASGGAVGALPWLEHVHASAGTRAYALIYEFFKRTEFDTESYVKTSHINSLDHLAQTRLWSRQDLERQ